MNFNKKPSISLFQKEILAKEIETELGRYKNQTIYVKVLRWAYWKPYYFCYFIKSLAQWILSGMNIKDTTTADYKIFKHDSKISVIGGLWLDARSRGDLKMKNYATLIEIFDEGLKIKQRIYDEMKNESIEEEKKHKGIVVKETGH